MARFAAKLPNADDPFAPQLAPMLEDFLVVHAENENAEEWMLEGHGYVVIAVLLVLFKQ